MRQRTSLRESSVEELLRGSDQQPAALGSGRRLLTGAEPPPALRTIRRLVAALVAVAAVALAALAVSVWQLVQGDAAPTSPRSTAEAPAGARPRASPPAAPDAPVEAPVPAQRPRQAGANLVLHAARGNCWLEIRIGSRSGRIVHAGTLAQGRTLRVGAQRLWVAFGAGAHLDVTLNGERVASFPSGTAAVVVTAGGVGEPRSV